MTPLRQLRHGATWSFASRVLFGLVTVGVGVVLARLLGPADLGLYFLFVQVVALFSLAHCFGLRNSLMKLAGIASAAGDWPAVRRLVGVALRLFGLASVALVALYALAWPLLQGALFKREFGLAVAGLILVVIAARSVEELASALLRGAGRIGDGVMLLGLPREGLFFVTVLGLWLAGREPGIEPVFGIYLVVALGVALAGAALVWSTVRGRPAVGGPVAATGLATLVGLSFPMLVQSGASLVFQVSDLWVLGFARSSAEVGVYGAAQRLTNLSVFALGVVNLALPPLIAALHGQGRVRELQQVARAAATWSAAVAIPVLVVVVLAGGWLLAAIFGPAFAAGATVLTILTLGQTVNAVAGSPGVILQMIGNHAFLTKLTTVVALGNIAGSVAVVDRFGAEGVATVTATAIVVQNLAMAAAAYRRAGVLSLPDPRLLTLAALRRLVRRNGAPDA